MSAVHRLETGYQPEPAEKKPSPREDAALVALAAETIEYQHALIKTIKGLFETIERHDLPGLYRAAPEVAQRLRDSVGR